MIRPTTLGLLFVASVAGAVLFQVSYGARALKDELNSLDQQIAADKDEMHVLRAEWSYLNQPARLEELNRRHLGLKPISGDQVVKLEDLPLRQLPAAVPIANPPPPAAAVVEIVAVPAQVEKIPARIHSVAVKPRPKPAAPASIEAAAAPPPATISSRVRAVTITPRPKPLVPVRAAHQPAPRVVDRSLDDVLAELLSPAPGNAP